MSSQSPVDRLYNEALQLVEKLEADGEISLANVAAENLRKSLLLAAASHFEHRIKNLILELVRERTGESILITSFVENKALNRQYHTLFDWTARKASSFYGLFGAEFKEYMGKYISDHNLEESVGAFLEIGYERNRLVHNDFPTFPLEKTFEEIYELYKKACNFVDNLPLAWRKFEETQAI